MPSINYQTQGNGEEYLLREASQAGIRAAMTAIGAEEMSATVATPRQIINGKPETIGAVFGVNYEGQPESVLLCCELLRSLLQHQETPQFFTLADNQVSWLAITLQILLCDFAESTQSDRQLLLTQYMGKAASLIAESPQGQTYCITEQILKPFMPTPHPEVEHE